MILLRQGHLRGQVSRLLRALGPLGWMIRFILNRPQRKGGRRRIIADIMWSSDQFLIRLRMKVTTPERIQTLKQELMEGNGAHRPECLITGAMPSRQIGNRDNRLKHFLQSFVEMTQRPERVEILIKVDDDDDLLFFRRMKRRYGGKINMRFVVSPRGRGYADLHNYHATLLPLRSPSSRMWFFLTDDCIFVTPKWDSELLSVLPDSLDDCFIATDLPFEKAIAIHGPNPVSPVPIHWTSAGDFPILGFGVVGCNQRAAEGHPGWTFCGNLWNADAFVGDILRRLWQRYQVNLHVQTKHFVGRTGVVMWHENRARNRIRSDTMIAFFSEANQKVRDEMAHDIYRYLIESNQRPSPKSKT